MGVKIKYKDVDAVITRHLDLFRKPGVISVRPGYKWICGVLVDKPCIVVAVEKKKGKPKPEDKLPLSVEDYLVDVVEATPMQKLRAKDEESFRLLQQHGPSEWREPEHPLERKMPEGTLLKQISAIPKKSPKGGLAADGIGYRPPQNLPLKAVSGKMTITANASPDGGFEVLTDFLAATKKRLTVAMYSFTSGDVLKAVVNAVKTNNADFTMVIDGPPNGTTHPQQTDAQSRTSILNADPNAKINWALEKENISRGRVTQFIFPAAYHIKVAVRDSSSFWLSSGNFNVSNQPNVTIATQKGPFDRDWHVVVDNEELAKLFEAYIQNDFDVAGQNQAADNQTGTETIKKVNAAIAKVQKESGAKEIMDPGFPNPPSKLGVKEVFTNVDVTVQPLLTPDTTNNGKNHQYLDQIISLIGSAQTTLDMQFQYIAAYDRSKAPDYMRLLDAVQAAIDRGVTVRIITSQFESKWREKIVAAGFDDINSLIKIQNRVHNKGIIVDRQKVLVSSQNWSAEGTLTNRDAGVIITNTAIAAYYTAIFEDDFKTRVHKPNLS